MEQDTATSIYVEKDKQVQDSVSRWEQNSEGFWGRNWSNKGFHKNIARGTTDPRHLVQNSNHPNFSIFLREFHIWLNPALILALCLRIGKRNRLLPFVDYWFWFVSGATTFLFWIVVHLGGVFFHLGGAPRDPNTQALRGNLAGRRSPSGEVLLSWFWKRIINDHDQGWL